MYVVPRFLHETRIYRTLSTIDQSRVISHNDPYIFTLNKIANGILISRREFNMFVEYLFKYLMEYHNLLRNELDQPVQFVGVRIPSKCNQLHAPCKLSTHAIDKRFSDNVKLTLARWILHDSLALVCTSMDENLLIHAKYKYCSYSLLLWLSYISFYKLNESLIIRVNTNINVKIDQRSRSLQFHNFFITSFVKDVKFISIPRNVKHKAHILYVSVVFIAPRKINFTSIANNSS